MTVVDEKILSKDDLAIVSTAITALEKIAEQRRGLVLCSDGRTRRLNKLEWVQLLDRVTVAAGYPPGQAERDGLEAAKAAGGRV